LERIMATDDLTADRLRELLDYDAETGWFTQKQQRGRFGAGRRTGAKGSHGYVRVRVDDAYYAAHRLAWLHFYGVWPAGILDHINGQRDDNRIANLRSATVFMNAQNYHAARSDSLTGFLGVSKTRTGKFSATIGAHLAGHKLQLYLGAYATPEEAHAVYVAAKRRLHEGCTI
jgi:hypothetical protein